MNIRVPFSLFMVIHDSYPAPGNPYGFKKRAEYPKSVKMLGPYGEYTVSWEPDEAYTEDTVVPTKRYKQDF